MFRLDLLKRTRIASPRNSYLIAKLDSKEHAQTRFRNMQWTGFHLLDRCSCTTIKIKQNYQLQKKKQKGVIKSCKDLVLRQP